MMLMIKTFLLVIGFMATVSAVYAVWLFVQRKRRHLKEILK